MGAPAPRGGTLEKGREALKHYGLKTIAEVEECGSEIYAITAERKVDHPAAKAIMEGARARLVRVPRETSSP